MRKTTDIHEAPEADGPRRPENVRSEDYGELQHLVDGLFRDKDSRTGTVRRIDVVVQAEQDDLPEDLVEVVGLLPPGTYSRSRLCDQLNSTLAAHGWGRTYGIVS